MVFRVFGVRFYGVQDVFGGVLRFYMRSEPSLATKQQNSSMLCSRCFCDRLAGGEVGVRGRTIT